MSINKHVDAGRFHNLQKILSAWSGLNYQYCVSIRKDAPWWYNERASLSIFTAAIWRAGGVALEEYSTRKGHGQLQWTGRCDIYCNIGTSHFAGESKMVWLSLRKKPETNIRKIENTLEEACSDAKDLKRYEGRRFGICFAPVYLPERDYDRIDELLLRLQQEILSEKYDALAWCFPPEARILSYRRKSGNCTYFHPGLFVFLKRV